MSKKKKNKCSTGLLVKSAPKNTHEIVHHRAAPHRKPQKQAKNVILSLRPSKSDFCINYKTYAPVIQKFLPKKFSRKPEQTIDFFFRI